MSTPPPHVGDDLDAVLDHVWDMLTHGASDRRSALHQPVVATVAPRGGVRQRVMVLREADRAHRSLRFHTDVRADKVDDLNANAALSVLGYDPDAKTQIRLRGTARVLSADPATDAAWDATSLFGKRCYLADPAPGTRVDEPRSGLPNHLEGVKPTTDEVRPARGNFAILRAVVTEIEWLYLAHTGHRRARFAWSGDGAQWDGSWLVP